ncbi:MAG TPA: alpha-hydroxy acid oxidase [Gaiellaceae bacterium]|jgi:isopentenyl diphosphate isomerase/L-lactate dehydrogenase-like FMN-dependent dehydrogenase
MAEPVNVAEYERLAEELLEPGAFAYYAGGAGDEWTLQENIASFNRWLLQPRMLVDVGSVTTHTTVLGQDVSMPILVAPTALQRLAHPDAEVATARAAAAAGTIFCQSTVSSFSPGELAAAAPEGTRWFQLYWSRDRGFTGDLAAAAADAGFSAIVLTVDVPAAGRRERDLRVGFEVSADIPLPNLAGHFAGGDFQAAFTELVDPTITWRDLEWLASLTKLPLVIKGILTSEDARLACEHGAAGVVVSNHGGRQLDGVAATLDALPEVVETCAGEATVLLDSGVRRGTDVVKALALGARAVLVGRAVLWGLVVDGEDGVRRVLELLRAEVELALTLLGCPSPEAVREAHVRRAAS